MNKPILLILLSFTLFSCQDNAPIEILDSKQEDKNLNSANYAISPEEALANLEDFLSSDEPDSRGATKKEVSSISAIKYPKHISRSNDIDCENLMYVANFEDEQGYAILAADTRIPESVIAITDEGILTDATVYSAIELLSQERVYFSSYPTTGPGIFTLPEYEDELFMNPNTVVLYNDTIGDTMVGTLLNDNYELEQPDSGPIDWDPIPYPNGPNKYIELFTTSLCAEYAINSIGGSDNDERYEKYEVVDERDVEKGGTVYHVVTKQYNWVTASCSSNILESYKNWYQGAPFNDLYPERRRFILVGHKKKAPAGCFPLAIAKILSLNQYPVNFTYEGLKVDWSNVNSRYIFGQYGKDKAVLLKGISSGCSSWYFYQGTFTFPHKATSFMRKIGYNNAHSKKYDFSKVKGMIDDEKPLIIYSIPGIRIDKSHSWNIDGYKIKERKIVTEEYAGKILKNAYEKTEICRMVHCDFGSSGQCNGYYVSGIFNQNDTTNIEFDNPSLNGEKTNYNHYIRIITYDKPNQP